ncbi:MAG: hypothetical protein ACM3S1_10485 [Hyphomicrobiales bacterium]
MARLSMAQRKSLPASTFVFPAKAPGPGSYPIPDRAHAVDALSRASGKPEEAAVRKAVCAKFGLGCPGKGSKADKAEDRADGGRDEASERY